MARRQICGWETGDSTESSALTGTASVQSSVKRTGSSALRCNPTTTGVGNHFMSGPGANGVGAAFNAATLYPRIYFRYGTKPSADSEPIFQSITSGFALKMEVRIGSDGKLSAWDKDVAQMGSAGATVLSADTWYCIEVKVGTGTTADWEVRVEGVSELSGTGNLTTTNNGFLQIGKASDRNGETVDFYYDDLSIDDAAYPGPGEIKIMLPEADGFYTALTPNTGAAWECVRQTPHDSDTTYIETSTSGHASTFALPSVASAGITSTVKTVKSFTTVREVTSVTSAFQLRLRSATTDSDTTSFNGSTAYASLAKLHETDPATGAAWVLSALDSIEVGVEANAAVAHRCTLCCAMVEYEPAAAGQPIIKRMGGVPYLSTLPQGVW